MFNLAPLILLFPLVGLLFNIFVSRRWREPAAGVIASAAAGLAFVGAVLQWAALRAQPASEIVTLATWLQVGRLNIPWAFQIDTLSVTMMLVVTGVSTLIHVYAIGYMQGDPHFTRFFVYLNLFLAAMLLLVMADNYLVMFVGWEGVGLCSYLLIGFWFDKGKDGIGNATAARKAFVVNRIGDFGLILAMILMFWHFGTLTFRELFAQAEATLAVGTPFVIVITLLLLLGATGKSAQIPLFVWLPDAMAGPTPVSALIHAATMVTAGIYMIARSHVLFALAPPTQEAVALIGAATALVAATIAIVQFDIKRVLAYSTISQLGFMVAAVGLGAYVAGLFHLITHAFFKALLFLAAGSVIHGLEHGGEERGERREGLTTGEERGAAHDLQDMRVMGGLRGRLPVTFGVYVVGALALAGLPPLAGFFSKDEILTEALAHNSAVFVLLLLAALGTAFYMGRQLWLVFFGASRSDAAAHAQESKLVMTIPLIGLALLAVVGGGLNLPGSHALAHWLEQTLGHEAAAPFNPLLAGITTVLALAMLGLAYRVYSRHSWSADGPDPLQRGLGPLFQLFNHRWWLDEAYAALLVQPYNRFSNWLQQSDTNSFLWLDSLLVRLTQTGAAALRTTQTGQLNWNVVGIVVTLIIVLAWLMVGG